MHSITLATIIINLLSTVVWCHHYTDALQLLKQLSDFYRFDHHIFFMGPSTDIDRWVLTRPNLDNLIPRTIYTFHDHSKQTVLNGKSGKNAFIVVVILGGLKFERSQLLDQVKAIRALDINVKIGVFFDGNITLDIIEQLFSWSWNAGIVNILSAFHLSVKDQPSLNVFKYDPFRASVLVNMTSSESPRDYFPGNVPDYHKHPLRILQYHELDVSDIEMEFWKSVESVFNASLLPLYAHNNNDTDTNRVTVDLMVYESRVMNAPIKVYPHRQSVLGMMVPHSHPYSGFIAYLRNGTWMLFFVYTLIVIVASSLLLIVSGYERQNKFFLFKCVAHVVNLLMNDNTAIRYQNLCRSDIFVIVPLTFTGLILMNGILSIFQSYLTSPIYRPQINTIKDLYTSSVPILANQQQLKNLTLILQDISKYGGWPDKFRGMHADQLLNEIRKFNDSIAFFAFDFQARRLLEAQKRLNLKAYHCLRDTFIAKYPISFEIGLEFPFMEHISDIIHWLNGAGLIDKWVKNSNDVVDLSKINPNRRIELSDESDMGEFGVLTVVWCGWIASAIAFIGELMWNKIKNRAIHH